MAMVIDKANPSTSWVDSLREKFPTENEWDHVLTSKQQRRSGPGYTPLSVDDIVTRLNVMLSNEIEGDFSISEANWLAGGASKLQVAFWLEWDKPGTGKTRERMVLRMEPPESAVETSRRREFEILAAMDSILPVPAALWVDPDATYMQYPALICGFVNGVTKPSGITSSVTGIGINFGPDFREPLAKDVIRDMAIMHNWDWRSANIPSFDIPELGTQAVEWNLNHWARVWEEDCNEEVPFVNELAHWLKANMPPIDQISLTHNDFRSGNFLFDEKSGKITSWLDWELAHLGDRHQELGFFAVENMGHYSEDGKQLIAHGLMPMDWMLEEYERVSGLSVNRRTVEYYRVFFCYRAAVIILGTCIRAAMGGKTHQDLTVAWLSAFAYRNLDEARQVLERIG
ncbi:aminoglycoside phosphotransferase [Sphingomonadales bacterium EhC05]|nr:aminoglycoside phosphotransferase [Sphingomonadales bacterium EhC05]